MLWCGIKTQECACGLWRSRANGFDRRQTADGGHPPVRPIKTLRLRPDFLIARMVGFTHRRSRGPVSSTIRTPALFSNVWSSEDFVVTYLPTYEERRFSGSLARADRGMGRRAYPRESV